MLRLLFITQGLILATFTIHAQPWIEQNPDPLVLRSVYFTDCNNGWAVGRRWIGGTGKIYYTNDGGKHWVFQASGLYKYLEGVHFVDNNNGWAVGEWGKILHTTNGGITWFVQNSG
ncbi:hypothetical protein KAX35_09700, partial [candidate division WOR-3 bacterium]|nr:hypothetical protein [candidate division WOR-3 bacterium]